MEPSPPRQTNSSTIGQEFLLVLQKSMVHDRVRKGPQLVLVLSHIIHIHDHLSTRNYVRSTDCLQRSIF